MYQVLFDALPLYDPRDEELSLHFQDPDVHLAVDEAGEMRFTLSPDHPYAARVTRTKGVVQLLSDGLPVFKGRIRKDTRGFYKSRELEVEGLLACLNDSVVPPFDFPADFLADAEYTQAADSGNVVEFFLAWLLRQHNEQVGPTQQIQLGEVTVRDPNNYISPSSGSYLTTMEAVRKKLQDSLGGYLLPDYSGEVTKLNYYADLPLTNVQPVKFGKNLLDLISELNDTEIYTAILPVGADGLTIEVLPDGDVIDGIWKRGKLLFNKGLEEELGVRITRVEEWKDVTLADSLQVKAIARLREGVKTTQTITAKAADLGAVEDLPRFVVGRYVQLDSAPHGFLDSYPLMELNPDILDPGNTEITLGTTVKAATDIAHANQSAYKAQQDQVSIDLGRQQEQIGDLASSIQTQITEVVQTCEQIILAATDSLVEVSDLETYKETVRAELSLLADQLVLKFTEVTEQIVDVDGDLQKTSETLAKHFTFEADGLTIKAGEGSMTLVLDNDVIYFRKDGQQFGWWNGVDFHTGNIVIDVNERAQLGNFAFVPRSNGSLSFLKVGG